MRSVPPETPALPRLLTATELSEATGLPTWRIYELVREDKIPHVRVNRSVRFSAAAVASWLEDGGTGYARPVA